MNLYASNLFERKFVLDKSHQEYTSWRIYHDESQIAKYHLKENDNVYLFNTTNLGYFGKNINQLNRIFCEGVGILYPWLNNLKSEIIGFQHYRRYYNYSKDNLNLEDIYNGKIQVFNKLYLDDYTNEHCRQFLYKDAGVHFTFWKEVNNGFYDDFIEFVSNKFPEYLESLKTHNALNSASVFVCTWNNYVKMCEFIWEYLNFVANKYSINFYDDIEWAVFVKRHFIDFNSKNKISPRKVSWDIENDFGKDNWFTYIYNNPDHFKYGLYRIFSFNIEYLISVFANYIGTTFNKNNTIKFIKFLE